MHLVACLPEVAANGDDDSVLQVGDGHFKGCVEDGYG